MEMAGRQHEPHQRREDHERHHPRLEQGDVIGDFGLGNPRREIDRVVIDDGHCETLASLNSAAPFSGAVQVVIYCTRGSVSNWWNGGGDDSVHSSVVAPAPHGLLAACSLRMKASIT